MERTRYVLREYNQGSKKRRVDLNGENHSRKKDAPQKEGGATIFWELSYQKRREERTEHLLMKLRDLMNKHVKQLETVGGKKNRETRTDLLFSR